MLKNTVSKNVLTLINNQFNSITFICRVRGISGLRVVDLSIAPEIPGGNTCAPTVMIAEKAADIIRAQITVKHVEL